MNKLLLIILFLCVHLLGVNAQEPQESYILSSQESGTKNYVARDYIFLRNGFSYIPGSGESLKLQIDKLLVFSPKEGTYRNAEGELSAYNLDGDGSIVGKIPGSSNVTNSGTFTYNIPISIPAGVNNMQPSISLNYSSTAKNGIAGYGWSLAGSSAIMRVPKTEYFDDADARIDWTKESPFALDGNRLIIENDYTDSIEYKTEIATYSKIMAYGIEDFGPSYFLVYTKDGKVIQYGNPSNRQSYLVISGSDMYNPNAYKIFANLGWAISKVTDSNGNYIDYTYNFGFNATPYFNCLLTKIEYGGNENAGTSHYASIDFTYENRTDITKNYISGFEFNQQNRLTDIQVSVNGTNLTSYDLIYADGDISQLASIELRNEGTRYVYPLDFTYGEDKLAETKTEIPYTDSDNGIGKKIRALGVADIDGDGQNELLDIYSMLDNGGSFVLNQSYAGIRKVSDNWEEGNSILLANSLTFVERNFRGLTASSIFMAGNTGTLNLSYITGIDNISSGLPGMFVDFNGDNALDILRQGIDNNKFSFGIVDRKNNEVLKEETLLNPISSGETLENPFVATGYLSAQKDYTSDLLIIIDNPQSVSGGYKYKYVLYLGNKNGIINRAPVSDTDYYEFTVPSKIESMSLVNFSGLPYSDDLMLILENSDTYVIKNSQTVSCFSDENSVFDLGFDIGKYGAYSFGDFNSDGTADIIYRDKIRNWNIAYNIGNGPSSYTFVKKELGLMAASTKYVPGVTDSDEPDRDRIFVGDINMDGMVDIVLGDESDFDFSTDWTVYLQTVDGFDGFRSYSSNQSGSCACLADINADGMLNFVYFDDNDKIQVVDFGFTIGSNYLTQVYNPLSGSQKISYKPITDCDDYDDDETTLLNDGIIDEDYNLNSTEDYLNINCQRVKSSSMMVASQIQEGLDTVTYYYGSPIVNWNVRGFMGCRYFGVENERTGMTQVSYYAPLVTDAKYYAFVAYKSVTGKSINLGDGVSTNLNPPISKIKTETSKYKIKGLGGKRYALQLESKTAKDHLTTIEKTINYEDYDNYGNVLLTSVSGYDEYYEETRYHYVKRGSWCLNKVDSIKLFKEAFYDDAVDPEEYTRISYFEYDNSGNLTSEVKDPGDVNALTTSYSAYDLFGHPWTIATSANGTTRTISKTYSSDGRFLETETDILNNTISYDWDVFRGRLNSETDKYGSTSYEYDEAGRLLKTTSPQGLKQTSTTQWADLENAIGAFYYTYKDVSGSSSVTTWYDQYGREIQTDTYLLNDKKISVSKEYDDQGRLFRVSQPFEEGGQVSYASTHYYDTYGRDTLVITPQGETSFIYNKLVNTIISPNQTKIVALNEMGQKIGQEINGKTVHFTYKPSGQLRSSVPQGSPELKWEMDYDLQGNRIYLSDPDAGVITSEYNGFGEIIRNEHIIHINSSANVDSFVYTNKGLLKEKYTNGELTSYTYDDNYNVSSVSVEGKHTQTFTYDDLDRVIGVNETVLGEQSFTTGTEYDELGRVKKETYPSGYAVSYKYDSYGNLVKLTDSDNADIWTAQEVNRFGQLTKMKNGNRQLNYNYDEKGLIESIKSPNVICMNYVFYNDGNMEYRMDSLSMQKEEFFYDQLKRLTDWDIYKNGSLSKANSIQYDDQYGNITDKTDIDYSMQYGNNTPPHALSSISGNPDVISDITQDIAYTDFNKMYKITEGSDSIILAYGVDHYRRKADFWHNGVHKTKYYLGNYEEEHLADGTVRKIHYIDGGNGLSAIKVIHGNQDTLYYAFTDHLGSLVALTNNRNSNIEKQSFDPWGIKRSNDNWDEADNVSAGTFSRGFTMHEHYYSIGLINMNGRVYDPALGSFLSPDPQLQSPGNWLNYNKYSYCLNNPLLYTDPTGEWFGIDDLIAAGVGFVAGYLSYGISTGNYGWKAVVAGGITAGVSWLGWNTFGAGAASNAKTFSQGMNAVFGNAGGNYGFRYASVTAMNAFSHKDQLKQADEKGWNGVWAMAGYGASAALTSMTPAKVGKGAISGSRTFAGIVLADNISDNMEDGLFSSSRYHIGILGYDFDKREGYSIFSSDLSDKQRFEMGYETVFGLSLIQSNIKRSWTGTGKHKVRSKITEGTFSRRINKYPTGGRNYSYNIPTSYLGKAARGILKITDQYFKGNEYLSTYGYWHINHFINDVRD